MLEQGSWYSIWQAVLYMASRRYYGTIFWVLPWILICQFKKEKKKSSRLNWIYAFDIVTYKPTALL